MGTDRKILIWIPFTNWVSQNQTPRRKPSLNWVGLANCLALLVSLKWHYTSLPGNTGSCPWHTPVTRKWCRCARDMSTSSPGDVRCARGVPMLPERPRAQPWLLGKLRGSWEGGIGGGRAWKTKLESWNQPDSSPEFGSGLGKCPSLLKRSKVFHNGTSFMALFNPLLCS